MIIRKEERPLALVALVVFVVLNAMLYTITTTRSHVVRM